MDVFDLAVLVDVTASTTLCSDISTTVPAWSTKDNKTYPNSFFRFFESFFYDFIGMLTPLKHPLLLVFLQEHLRYLLMGMAIA